MSFDFDLLFPKHSLRGQEGAWVTEQELQLLRPKPIILEGKELDRSGVESLDSLFAVSAYRDQPLLKKAIHSFKYKKIQGLQTTLTRLLCDAVESSHLLLADAVLCPVPLHWSRQFQRGFNQAAVLAQALGERFDLPVIPLLKRVRPTGHQAWRNREERWMAVNGAFRFRARAGAPLGAACPEHSRRTRGLRGVRVRDELERVSCAYLVDDLFTTGATMEQCAKALKRAGVKRVEGIVLSRG